MKLEMPAFFRNTFTEAKAVYEHDALSPETAISFSAPAFPLHFPIGRTISKEQTLKQYLDSLIHTAGYDRTGISLLIKEKPLKDTVIIVRNPFVLPDALYALGKISDKDRKTIYAIMVHGLMDFYAYNSNQETLFVDFSKSDLHSEEIQKIVVGLDLNIDASLSGKRDKQRWFSGKQEDLFSARAWVTDAYLGTIASILGTGIPWYTKKLEGVVGDEVDEVNIIENDSKIILPSGELLDLSKGINEELKKAITTPADEEGIIKRSKNEGINKIIQAKNLSTRVTNRKPLVVSGAALTLAVGSLVLFKRKRKNTPK